jgi:hypothetical protein
MKTHSLIDRRIYKEIAVSYGEDGSRQALDVQPGDRVLFGKKVNGEELLIMRKDDHGSDTPMVSPAPG